MDHDRRLWCCTPPIRHRPTLQARIKFYCSRRSPFHNWADIFSHYHLLPDLKLRKLVDGNQLTRAPAFLNKPFQISFLAPNHKFAHIINKFPSVFGSSQLTTGPPVSQSARRLSPAKVKAAKVEFRKWCEVGICRPSNSPWASPLHMESKKNGKWRPCGDYRKLNLGTVPDRYPIPHMHDMAKTYFQPSTYARLTTK